MSWQALPSVYVLVSSEHEHGVNHSGERVISMEYEEQYGGNVNTLHVQPSSIVCWSDLPCTTELDSPSLVTNDTKLHCHMANSCEIWNSNFLSSLILLYGFLICKIWYVSHKFICGFNSEIDSCFTSEVGGGTMVMLMGTTEAVKWMLTLANDGLTQECTTCYAPTLRRQYFEKEQ